MKLTSRLLLPCLLAFASLTADGASPPSESPEQVVRAFNAALSERKLDVALALVANGAVNFNLESAHSFTAAPGASSPLTSDLVTHWRTVAPLLYSTQRRYLREVESASTKVDGSLAVVWTRLRTTTEPTRGATTRQVFAETYLLHLEAGRWRIAGVANSRQMR